MARVGIGWAGGAGLYHGLDGLYTRDRKALWTGRAAPAHDTNRTKKAGNPPERNGQWARRAGARIETRGPYGLRNGAGRISGPAGLRGEREPIPHGLSGREDRKAQTRGPAGLQQSRKGGRASWAERRAETHSDSGGRALNDVDDEHQRLHRYRRCRWAARADADVTLPAINPFRKTQAGSPRGLEIG
ncbi:hypothetical protein BC834DRAFT_848704, partial [Gloeopeniophorella convolvens]